MANALYQQQRHGYINWASYHIQNISEDQFGNFAEVPCLHSEKVHIVRFKEVGKDVPRATACDCEDRHYRKKVCKHMEALDRFWDRVYAPHVERRCKQARKSEIIAPLNGNRGFQFLR